ncbi:hypothetical protein FIBSPDRAFT_950293 [Athelia psychrophila]|uniref:Uncharacterized protein n=1 Tax=Athelia psychrophila TaxID=1759441 RepID=A0A166P172_9AGAM|nr:hypothetical protein FIBSPDRAFT_950293 [Fibularhizoctonia sp. CBS 109695]
MLEPVIQNGLNDLVAAQGAFSRMASLAAVLIITLDLSFFIWDKQPSRTCLSQALSIYKEATTNHEAVMKAVTVACRMKQGDSEAEKIAFRARMEEIVLVHRLSENYRVGTGRA